MPDGLIQTGYGKNGGFCSRSSSYVVVPQEPRRRLKNAEELLPHFLETKALAFYTAVEAINFFTDRESGSDQIYYRL